MALGRLIAVNYMMTVFSTVTNLADFFKGPLPEIKSIKKLYSQIKLVFNAPEGRVIVQCGEGSRIYKFLVLSNDVHKYPVCNFIYIPEENRLDFFSMDMPHIPMIQWKNKKAVFKNYSEALDRAGMDKIFNSIINTL